MNVSRMSMQYAECVIHKLLKTLAQIQRDMNSSGTSRRMHCKCVFDNVIPFAVMEGALTGRTKMIVYIGCVGPKELFSERGTFYQYDIYIQVKNSTHYSLVKSVLQSLGRRTRIDVTDMSLTEPPDVDESYGEWHKTGQPRRAPIVDTAIHPSKIKLRDLRPYTEALWQLTGELESSLNAATESCQRYKNTLERLCSETGRDNPLQPAPIQYLELPEWER